MKPKQHEIKKLERDIQKYFRLIVEVHPDARQRYYPRINELIDKYYQWTGIVYEGKENKNE